MDGGEFAKIALEILSLGPKHAVRDNFNDLHLLADSDKLVSEIRKINTVGEKLCQIEASAKSMQKM